LPDRYHDFAGIPRATNADICPTPLTAIAKANEPWVGTQTAEFTISSPYMYLESVGIDWDAEKITGATFGFADGLGGADTFVWKSNTIGRSILSGGSPETTGEITRVYQATSNSGEEDKLGIGSHDGSYDEEGVDPVVSVYDYAPPVGRIVKIYENSNYFWFSFNMCNCPASLFKITDIPLLHHYALQDQVVHAATISNTITEAFPN